MSIETDIKQSTPFRSPYQRVIVNLMYTSNWIAGNQTQLLKPFKLTLQQYNVLRILRGQHPSPIKVSDITERMLDKMSNASRLVDKLVAKKLVLRTECPSDRRAVDVIITEKGLALLKQLDTHQDTLNKSFEGKLTAEEAEALSHLLDRLRA
ncbi:MarR family winged helix-turn-helix transcriptional regulator [Spirosoma fluviale]|uniref:DNA-binding transcriptional regulator, MarR family n=1 Tax=Spirosoma fluviale TaxID=1597977 RepID=A0A286F522_9BACT|nr:MarR family transcriptional regulator [Spirosoma fluviale]SOD78216.1 DNA-binding transcriptional regulator, MarR family [Spirosoma fluviale]